ncbi:MAG: hypothetical protein WAK91_13110 [Candidatus Acidiferrales bacterium]|jgi:hypothetical protein
MAEEAGTKRVAVANHPILVSLNNNPNPLATTAAITDTITFTVGPPSPVSIWTWDANGNPANIFAGETGNYIPGPIGPISAKSFNTSVVSKGQTVSFQANANPPSEHSGASAKDVVIGVKGTITISNVGEP